MRLTRSTVISMVRLSVGYEILGEVSRAGRLGAVRPASRVVVGQGVEILTTTHLGGLVTLVTLAAWPVWAVVAVA